MKKEKLISQRDGLPIRSSGPWIRKKHHYLIRYADIFTRGMKNKWELTYLDLFAGPGCCLIEKEMIELAGSPLLALGFDFRKYIFIEQDHDDLEALKQRCSKSPKLSQIQFIEGDCNKNIDQIRLTGLTLAFIDPTGIDVHFETIKRLTSLGPVDLLINIPFHIDIKRNFTKYIKTQHKKLDLFLGGKVPWDKLHQERDVLELYKKRIKDLGYQTVEYSDIVVSNTNKVPMYFLFFASKHSRGVEFWKKITKKDETGQLELEL